MNNLSIRKMNELSKKKKKGFTLVELIIVIAIIAILAAMAIPKLGSMRNSARVSNDVAAAKNIATITSTLISDGTVTSTDSPIDVSGAAGTKGATIRSKLDGKVASSGNSEASPSNPFIVTVTASGGVSVSVNGHELYPDTAGTGRSGYAGSIS